MYEPSASTSRRREAQAARTIARLLLDDETFDHSERVASKLTPDAEALGWLHDVIEDTRCTIADLRYLGFDHVILGALRVITRTTEVETYFEYIERVRAEGSRLVLEVKLADLEDHFDQAATLTDSLRSRYEKAQRILESSALLDRD